MNCRLKTLIALALAASLGSMPVFAQGTLRIGMTASDIPLTTGQTDQGGEGMRFMGYTVYDGLINWDLSSADKPSGLVPGLATSWKVDDADKTKWTFKLRQGVKFHDGSDFKADAVVWNIDKLLNDKSPQFDPKQSAQGRSRIPAVKSYKVLDDYTVEIRTKAPDAFLPYQIAWVMMSSPAQWEKVGKDWNKFAQTPSGTGPWKVTASCRRPAPSWCRSRNTGTPSACRSSTSWCCCRCPKPRPAPRRCARARSTGSRRRRPTPCPASRRPASRS